MMICQYRRSPTTTGFLAVLAVVEIDYSAEERRTVCPSAFALLSAVNSILHFKTSGFDADGTNGWKIAVYFLLREPTSRRISSATSISPKSVSCTYFFVSMFRVLRPILLLGILSDAWLAPRTKRSLSMPGLEPRLQCVPKISRQIYYSLVFS